MQLTVWTYEGPPHVGAMRIATAMEGVHYVLHAPQGDTYADLLFTMIERRGKRPPVTYTTFQARDLGKDTAALFQTAVRDAVDRFAPQALLVGASCTAELIQDDPAGLASALRLPIPVIALELPSYQRKENWGAAETFYQLVRAMCSGAPAGTVATPPAKAGAQSRDGGNEVLSAPTSTFANGPRPSPGGSRPVRKKANILGPTALGFRHRDDVVEITRLLETLGIGINVVAPLGATPADLARLPDADFNISLYPEIADTACRWLERTYGQKTVRTVPIGHGATRDFIAEVAALAGVDPAAALDTSRLPWWSQSVDSTYLTGKRVFIFGDATHAVAAARVARDEFGFEVVGLGCYNREFAREIRTAALVYGLEPLITDDYLAVEDAIARLQPELVLGTQMERHIAKRLRIPCAVISAPVHVQDFPARYSPQMGFEGANVLFDTWVHPLVMGLEEHLLTMFRDDFEFSDHAGASHLGHGASPILPREPGEGDREHSANGGGGATAVVSPSARPLHHSAEEAERSPSPADAGEEQEGWSPEAERELLKIPFFVRGKARRNTERYATEHGIAAITLDTLYDAKAHYAR
ncbi:ferredoxin:protochlorophyllide reductase (ATP-dependent) subunit B [Sphingomonas sp. TREG-RG-20F-R18-01]|uniref:ferredoxin:protochlorophyllide reductase (ATP-dependent) subunit B n=1 Tax=Sphingomonas sp. TREG-RG-20F-R18-01 TaxID=2914982 RepID=UPI001F5A7496|nr:ferredoxin:protochlorophyllide reductase (ATP-dependent) subunit B [Sphingomonas sp. TREG-RG-20F-R18-01]